MADLALATAADYAEAMMTARKAKNLLFLILLAVLLSQLAIFFLYKYDVLKLPPPGVASAVTAATRTASDALASTTAPASTAGAGQWAEVLRYLVGLGDFLGIVLVVVLATLLLLVAKIMLVGRLIGVSRVTSSYVWCLVLAVLVFPWQAFLGDYAFKIPGVLYTWDELVIGGHFASDDLKILILKWARFAGFPILATIILLAVQVKSSRGMKMALGEVPLDTSGGLPSL